MSYMPNAWNVYLHEPWLFLLNHFETRVFQSYLVRRCLDPTFRPPEVRPLGGPNGSKHRSSQSSWKILEDSGNTSPNVLWGLKLMLCLRIFAGWFCRGTYVTDPVDIQATSRYSNSGSKFEGLILLGENNFPSLPVDGGKNPALHQLRLVVETPLCTRILAPSQVVVWDF